MDDDKKQSSIVTPKDAATTVGAASAAAASALMVAPSAAPGVLALAAALVAVFPPILGALTEAGVRRMKARGDRFFQALVDDWAQQANLTHEDVTRILEDAKDDPNIADASWRAVRGLMEALNDAAAVPLGVLAAEYMRNQLPADFFFRGAVRLLQELEADELDDLRKLLVWALSSTKRTGELQLVSRHGSIDILLDEFANDPAADSVPDKHSHISIASDSRRLFSLLTLNGLVGSAPTSRWGGGIPEINLPRNIAERLSRILLRNSPPEGN